MLTPKQKPSLTRLFSLIFVLISVFALSVSADGFLGKEVYLGGFPFGLKIDTEGVIVAEVSDFDSTLGRVSPAKDADIRAGDTILSVNGKRVDTVGEISDIISGSNGKRLTLEIKRNSVKLTKNLIPVMTKDKQGYKSGLVIKDDTAGIGTVTFVDSDKCSFGGLGHGICEKNTAEVLPLKSGTVHLAKIIDVARGTEDTPGELRGIIDEKPSGKLLKNTDKGVFGKFDKEWEALDKIKTAPKNEVVTGSCTVYTTLEGTSATPLDAEIVKIIDKNSGTKNFIVRLTDKKALEKSGGIVQGMSGSPIVQNGKLVGAVTHVLMRNQSEGYGIFIENMIKEGSSEPSFNNKSE